jgi:hypothetical protein
MARKGRGGGGGRGDSSKGKNPAAGQGKGNAPRRRQPSASSSKSESPEQRAARLQNTGVTPQRRRAERRVFQNTRTPTSINSQPQQTPTEVRAWIDDASSTLSLATQQALKRAEWYGDDASLLPVRPTHTSWPGNSQSVGPRTLAAGYDYQSMTLFVRFRGPKLSPNTFADGVGYEYYGVTLTEWERFRDHWSPGRYINEVLDSHPYTPATW